MSGTITSGAGIIDESTHRITVRWRDCDALGHVHHSVFLVYLEEARDAFLRRLLGVADPMYVVVRLEIDFTTEIARATPEVLARVSVQAIGRSSLTLRERIIHLDGRTAAECETTLVWWDRESSAPRAFTDAERLRLGQA